MNINHLNQIKEKIEQELNTAVVNLERLRGSHSTILGLIEVEIQLEKKKEQDTNSETENEKEKNLNPDLKTET